MSALIGGAMIGAASVWLLAANGRIAGVSSILHGFVTPLAAPDVPWRAWFIAGLLAAGLAWQGVAGPVIARESLPLGWVAAAGLLVGFGTRMGGGCTSGHGVCGLGRLSARSLVAVIVFMGTGMIATYGVRHALGVAS
jgi:uncharacterized membrane protein YedE/YeeE